jgi:hypothetical protein
MLRIAPMYVIGGGRNDIQRNVIARALGCTRSETSGTASVNW